MNGGAPAIGAGPVISGSGAAGSATDGPGDLGGVPVGIGVAFAALPDAPDVEAAGTGVGAAILWRGRYSSDPNPPPALSLPVRRWRLGGDWAGDEPLLVVAW